MLTWPLGWPWGFFARLGGNRVCSLVLGTVCFDLRITGTELFGTQGGETLSCYGRSEMGGDSAGVTLISVGRLILWTRVFCPPLAPPHNVQTYISRHMKVLAL